MRNKTNNTTYKRPNPNSQKLEPLYGAAQVSFSSSLAQNFKYISKNTNKDRDTNSAGHYSHPLLHVATTHTLIRTHTHTHHKYKLQFVYTWRPIKRANERTNQRMGEQEKATERERENQLDKILQTIKSRRNKSMPIFINIK